MLCAVSYTSSGLPRPFKLPSRPDLSLCILLLTLVELCFGRYLGRESVVVVVLSCQFQLQIILRASLDITALSRMEEAVVVDHTRELSTQ